MSNAKKEVDWVKWLGLSVAVLIFFGGQRYIAEQNAKRAAWMAAEAEKVKQEAEAKALEEAKARPLPPDSELIDTKQALELLKVKEEDLQSLVASRKLPAYIKAGEMKFKRDDVAAIKDGKAPVAPVPNIENAPANPVKPETDVAKAAFKEPAASPDVIVESSVSPLKLIFGSKGGTLRHATLVDQKLKPEKDSPPLELLDEMEPGKLTLGLPWVKIAGVDFENLETATWELKSDTKGFNGPGKTWVVEYARTLVKTEPNGTVLPLCEITRRFIMSETDRFCTLEMNVKNLTAAPAKLEYGLRGAAGVLMDGPAENPMQGYAVSVKCSMASRLSTETEPSVTTLSVFPADSPPDETKRRVSAEENMWATVHNRFYTAATVARHPEDISKIVAVGVHKNRRTDKAGDKRYTDFESLSPILYRREITLNPQAAMEVPDSFGMYCGPTVDDALSAFETLWNKDGKKAYYLPLSVQYIDLFGSRWPRLDWLARQLIGLFGFLHRMLGSYGIAVILLTLVVKAALHPLQRKSQVSMFKMQKLGPKMKEIEKKFANDKRPDAMQRKQTELMDLYRKEGVSPAGGCLPMFIQMPIFFALYGAFSHAFEIRQAQFLWIHDLSLADRLYQFGSFNLNLLPILYVGLTLYQTLAAPKPPNEDEQQAMMRKTMMFMPLMFAFIFYGMPSGLVLYFVANASFGLIESWYIKTFILKVDKHGNPLEASPALVTESGPSKGMKDVVAK